MLKNTDYSDLVRMGIRRARYADSQALEDAVIYWVVANENERRTVRAEFEEGVRNYCDGMAEYYLIMNFFDKRCRFVENDLSGQAYVTPSKVKDF